MSAATQASPPGDIRQHLREAVANLEHVLPGQAPIRDFVHHNTLHGFQHLRFPEALAAARELTGAEGYPPQDAQRALYAQGRITRAELEQVLNSDPDLEAVAALGPVPGRMLRRMDVYLAALLHPLGPLTGCQLAWQMDELDALRAAQPDLEPGARTQMLAAARARGLSGEAAAVADLWAACLEGLGLEHYILHPEDLIDLSPEQAERMLGQVVGQEAAGGRPVTAWAMQREAAQLLETLLGQVGPQLTLRGLLLALTGQDLLEEARPRLIGYLAAYLDQGLAAWRAHEPGRGFYASWRRSAARDMGRVLEDCADWPDTLAALPEDALETVMAELQRLGLARGAWAPYLQRLALELPGWSGMFLWRHRHPGYQGQRAPVDMMDYLAVRLVLERLFARRLCRRLWRIEPSLDLLRWHLRRQSAELLVRWSLFNTHLPEYLVSLAQRLVDQPPSGPEQWLYVAQLVWTWRQSPAADAPRGHSVHRSAWPLFRLAQHLGLDGAGIRALGRPGLEAMLECLRSLDPDRAGCVWLKARENHYRDALFAALQGNRRRDPKTATEPRPSAQLVFCMDDREEGLRRHLEEISPTVQSFGAAGFFGVAMSWRGLDQTRFTALCPVGVSPENRVEEVAAPGQESLYARHRRRRARWLRFKDLFLQDTRRSLLRAVPAVTLAAPAALLLLAAKLLAPAASGALLRAMQRRLELTLPTRVALGTDQDGDPAAVGRPRRGFSDAEQAGRVEAFLRTIGLAKGFAPLVVMMGHGSGSQNNPHLAAYDCGACSGRHGGPNARVFAAMANRPQVRALLAARGIEVPPDTWFLGAEHDTCDESIAWYDLDGLPAARAPDLERLRADLAAARGGSAQERCRRFASAPPGASAQRALAHVAARSLDFSQPRPELGHAGNAAALIGRRALSRGLFLDRRVFLISYDPEQDPRGEVLESILLATTPVGAGINLEYYFSTVDNARYGAGSKVTHNLSALAGVMDGAAGDLRTGLPRQMIEIHEPMRLQVIVEAHAGVLAGIHARQPLLRELVDNGWVLLSAIDPDNADIAVFTPGRGFEPWRQADTPAPALPEQSPGG